MPRPTTARILNELKADGLVDSWERERTQDETHFRVQSRKIVTSHEIYGRKAVMYFSCNDEANIPLVQAAIRAAGGKVDTAWMGRDRPGCFSVEVSYFKGPRWWE